MKRLILTSGLVSLMTIAIHAQTGQPATGTSQQPPQNIGPDTVGAGLQPQPSAPQQQQPTVQQQQPPAQTPEPLPQTGQASGTMTNLNVNQTVKIQAVTAADRPIATQIQQVLTTEPVLAQTLPMVNIQVNGGVVLLNGDVQCGAESVLMQNLIQQKLPNVIRIENRLRLPGGAFAPARFR